MFVIGITGGIASGKRTLTEYLKPAAAAVVDADEIAKEVIAPGTKAYAALIDRFGSSIISGDGDINRHKLGEIVFKDANNVEFINRLTHPEIIRIIRKKLSDLAGSLARDDFVLLRVPLMAEVGLTDMTDMVVVVTADEDARIARAVERRGLTESVARQIIAAQASDAERTEIADIVIINDGKPDILEEGARAVLKEARRLSGEKRD